jgi:hypothetical protein
LSVAVVTQTLVILAKRGGGNSDTVVVLVALRRDSLIEVEGDRAQASQIGQRPLYTPDAPSGVVRSCAEGSAIHVMLALCRSSRQVVVAYEELHGTDMVRERLGKRQRLTYQA